MARVTVKNVRLSYAFIWKPKQTQDGKEKYSVAILFKKDDEKNVKAVKNAYDAAKKAGIEKFGTAFGTGKLKNPLHDGDEDHAGDAAYEGCYYLNASNFDKPLIVDSKRQEIMDQSEVYSGCYANVILEVYPYNHPANKGITCSLVGIQKVADGDSLGGRGPIRAEDLFEVLDDEDDFMK